MEQLILHLCGDYLWQSQWMADNKSKHTLAAFLHALAYALPFLVIGSFDAVCIIFSSHFFIDRFRLARFVVYAKNIALGPMWAFPCGDPACDTPTCNLARKWSWKNCSETGYPSEMPIWLSTWLLIIADNTLHLLINFLSLKYL